MFCWIKTLFGRASAVKLPAPLREVFQGSELVVVDIGARGGGLLAADFLRPYTHYIACEPNEDEVKQLSALLKEREGWREVTILPKAIALKEGEASLHLMKQRGLSSLLLPNKEVVDQYYSEGEFDIESTVTVRTDTLDHAAAAYGFQQACFLKIDTQGTELDILRSGEHLLSASVLGVYVEAEFRPFYSGQPLFSDVDEYLRSKGFSLFDLNRSQHRRVFFRKDLYSRRQTNWAHTLYFRMPERRPEDVEEARVTASRLLCLALGFDHNDWALELCSTGWPGQVLRERYGDSLITATESFIRSQTLRVRKQMRRKQSFEDLTAFAKKDRSLRYG